MQVVLSVITLALLLALVGVFVAIPLVVIVGILTLVF